MPQLVISLKAEHREDVVAGEFRVRASFENRSDGPARLNIHTASHPALVLEVKDAKDETVPLPPPSAPGPKDLERGDIVEPGASTSVEYAGFLDVGLPSGRYRVRYFGEFPTLGGTMDDPLRSDWLEFTVRRPRAITTGIQLTGLQRPAPEDVDLRRPIPLIHWLRHLHRWIHWFWCWLYCLLQWIFFRRRCDRILSQEIDQPRTETISNAPPGAEAWNGTYGWRARFLITVDEPSCQVRVSIRVRLVGTITAAQRAAWESAIEAAWNGRFALCCGCCCCHNGSEIRCDIQFVTSNEHQVANVGATTTNMGNWGVGDTVDVSHEFGHMLGALDEYFTVNGVDWGPGRQATGAIMNNPANPPVARHYDTVRAAASTALGATCSTIVVGGGC
jgi:hypothetical protein